MNRGHDMEGEFMHTSKEAVMIYLKMLSHVDREYVVSTACVVPVIILIHLEKWQT